MQGLTLYNGLLAVSGLCTLGAAVIVIRTIAQEVQIYFTKVDRDFPLFQLISVALLGAISQVLLMIATSIER